MSGGGGENILGGGGGEVNKIGYPQQVLLTSYDCCQSAPTDINAGMALNFFKK